MDICQNKRYQKYSDFQQINKQHACNLHGDILKLFLMLFLTNITKHGLCYFRLNQQMFEYLNIKKHNPVKIHVNYFCMRKSPQKFDKIYKTTKAHSLNKKYSNYFCIPEEPNNIFEFPNYFLIYQFEVEIKRSMFYFMDNQQRDFFQTKQQNYFDNQLINQFSITDFISIRNLKVQQNKRFFSEVEFLNDNVNPNNVKICLTI
eukprot:TRINITY_DN6057_c0_g1_i12.p1 TRINITY_DN6057_c0_g1~~TRINITY_DN6057_c0_g1_i12.p1  ORF type:complete len:203 (+),score=-1.98 TRINITY_DN6057_c0_g1_i12:904-1512(+)